MYKKYISIQETYTEPWCAPLALSRRGNVLSTQWNYVLQLWRSVKNTNKMMQQTQSDTEKEIWGCRTVQRAVHTHTHTLLCQDCRGLTTAKGYRGRHTENFLGTQSSKKKKSKVTLISLLPVGFLCVPSWQEAVHLPHTSWDAETSPQLVGSVGAFSFSSTLLSFLLLSSCLITCLPVNLSLASTPLLTALFLISLRIHTASPFLLFAYLLHHLLDSHVAVITRL